MVVKLRDGCTDKNAEGRAEDVEFSSKWQRWTGLGYITGITQSGHIWNKVSQDLDGTGVG